MTKNEKIIALRERYTAETGLPRTCEHGTLFTLRYIKWIEERAAESGGSKTATPPNTQRDEMPADTFEGDL